MLIPILQRELTTLLRRRRVVVAQAVVVAGLGVMMLVRYPSDAQVAVDGQQGAAMLRVFGYGLLAVAMLLGPAFPAATLVRERRSGTLALLLNAPTPRWPIVVGKLAAGVAMTGLLMALSLPGAAVCLAMGGVSAGQVMMLYGVLGLAGLMVASVSMVVSSYAAQNESAMRLSYALVLALCLATMAPSHFLADRLAGPAVMLTGWLRSASPLAAVMDVLGDADRTGRGLAVTGGAAQRFVLIALLTTVMGVVWVIRRLGGRIFDRARDSGQVTDDRSAKVRLARRFFFLIDPQRRSAAIGPLTNPVLAKELRTQRFGRAHWLLRLAGGSLVVSLLLVLATATRSVGWGVADLGSVIVLLQLSLLVLLTPALAAPLISAEVESGGWLLLTTTRLSALTIVTGKLMSAAWVLLLVLLATLPCYAALLYIDPNQWFIVGRTLGGVAMTSLFLLLVSAAAGCVLRQAAASTAAAYGLIVTLLAATTLIALARDEPFGHRSVELALSLNPVAATLALMRSPALQGYDLFPLHRYVVALACAMSLAVLWLRVRQLNRPR